jgi:hypothetical protein
MAKGIEILAFNDVLNDDVAHFFKSGTTRRSKQNDKLDPIHYLLPEKGNNYTNLEYDLWYDFQGEKKIRGYVYTDIMTKFVYLRPASSLYCTKLMNEVVQSEITEEGEEIFKDVVDSDNDKYKLRKTNLSYPFVIFLPGTNILNDVIDRTKIKQAIDVYGAKLKCHPLTSPFALSDLKNSFGEESIIDKKFSGHAILNNAETVGCCTNSEMGIVALAKGKKVKLYDQKGLEKFLTYTTIYNALSRNMTFNETGVKRLFSCKYSGLIHHQSWNPQEKINEFFNYFKEETHVPPERPKSLDTGRE